MGFLKGDGFMKRDDDFTHLVFTLNSGENKLKDFSAMLPPGSKRFDLENSNIRVLLKGPAYSLFPGQRKVAKVFKKRLPDVFQKP